MPFTLLIASGWTFFPGMLTLAVIAVLPVGRTPRRRLLQRLCMIIGAALVGIAAIPMPGWFYALAAAAVLAWLLLHGAGTHPRRRRMLLASRAAVVATALAAIGWELPRQFLRTLPRGECSRVFVIGDSLSAGLGDPTTTWPSIVARDHKLPVTNVARAGASTAHARGQAEQLGNAAGVVVVLIGGNDLLWSRPVGDFAHDLDAVLAQAAAHARPVVMFELPLPPLATGYGRVQRAVAGRYGVTLVPRWRLALLLARPGATTDGLHLTPAGHAALAELVWQCIGPACGGG